MKSVYPYCYLITAPFVLLAYVILNGVVCVHPVSFIEDCSLSDTPRLVLMCLCVWNIATFFLVAAVSYEKDREGDQDDKETE